MPPSLLQDGGRKAAELSAMPGRLPQPAGFFPPKFSQVVAGARPGYQSHAHV